MTELAAPARDAAPPRRLLAGLVALACLALLVVSAGLAPSTDGFGTHTQLGLAPCGWKAMTGKPCMTCGMTTAFAHAAEGSFLQSARAQPMGTIFCVLVAVTFWGALHSLLTGWHVERLLWKLLRPRVLWALAGGVLLAWGFKVLA